MSRGSGIGLVLAGKAAEAPFDWTVARSGKNPALGVLLDDASGG